MALMETTQLALENRRKLKRVLSRGDLILFSTSAVIGLDTVASSAGTGGFSAVTLMVVSALVFLLPYGMITAELGAAFPVEGGPYVWVKQAFGDYVGSVISFIYWISNPIWVASLAMVSIQILLTAFGGTLPPGWALFWELVIIWGIFVLEVTYLNIGKILPNAGAIVKILVLAGLGIGAVVVALAHGSANPAPFRAFLPSGVGILGFLPFLVFNWVGFELQTCASEEMKDPRRDVPRSILISGLIGALGYSLGILGVMLAVPSKHLSNITGLYQGFQDITHFPPLLALLAVAFIVGYLSSGTAWLIGVDRSFATTGWNRSIPRFLGHFHDRFGTPDRVAVLSALVSSLVLVLNYLTGGGLSESNLYQNLLGLTIISATLPYALMLPAFVVFRRRYPQVERPYTVPGGMAGAWVMMLIPEIIVILGIAFNFIPNQYASTNGSYFTWILWGTVGEIVVASVLYAIARREPAVTATIALDGSDAAEVSPT